MRRTVSRICLGGCLSGEEGDVKVDGFCGNWCWFWGCGRGRWVDGTVELWGWEDKTGMVKRKD